MEALPDIPAFPALPQDINTATQKAYSDQHDGDHQQFDKHSGDTQQLDKPDGHRQQGDREHQHDGDHQQLDTHNGDMPEAPAKPHSDHEQPERSQEHAGHEGAQEGHCGTQDWDGEFAEILNKLKADFEAVGQQNIQLFKRNISSSTAARSTP